MAPLPRPPAGAPPAPAGCALDVAPPAARGSRFYVGRRGEGVWVGDGAGVRRLGGGAAPAAWRGAPPRRLALAAALLEDATGAPAPRERVEDVAERLLLDLPAHAFVLTDADLR